jgi:HD-like signal output (HDOD) protein/ActR/RegA family two-component response regulator
MRILIVEDELVSRTKMETLMHSFGECKTTESGSQAVFLFAEALKAGKPYHLITLDINMPDMQGTKVLKIIRELEAEYKISDEERVRIMMVTAQMDKDQVLSCIEQGCDDYLAKPFNVQMIRKKLQRLCIKNNNAATMDETATQAYRKLSGEAILNDINQALRKGDIALPTLPQIGFEFREMVQNNVDLDQMADLLKKDMFISSKLVRMANSALYRGFGVVRTIEQAVSRLGLTTTEQMVTAISNQRLYAIETTKYRALLDRLWQHALASAFAGDNLGRSMPNKLLVDPFTAGLLHDIGALALIQIIAEMEKRGRFEQAIEMQALIETIEAYHAAFGAKLLEKWQFGFDYAHIALYHNSLHTAESVTQDLLVANLANLIAKSVGCTIFENTTVDDISESQSARELNIDTEQILSLQQSVKRRLAKTEKAIEN